MLPLVMLLLEHHADVNIINEDGRSPLHYAVANGHAEIAQLFVAAGADMHLRDRHGVRPLDMIENPGPIHPIDALQFFDIQQRSVRTIDRILHPELSPQDTRRGWKHGSGGWRTERLIGFETDMKCDIDQNYADEITSDEIFEKYIARSAPILIRGALNDWPMMNVSTGDKLKELHGNFTVLVSNVPYADKFGGEGERMTLGEYVDRLKRGELRGGRSPWYVFKGHKVPQQSEAKDSLVKECIAPPLIDKALRRVPRRFFEEPGTPEYRITDTNLQWNLGIEGSGSPVHFHNIAWTGSMYGAKKWYLMPPHDMIMSNKPIIKFIEEDLDRLIAIGMRVTTCVQTAGDLMNWGHGVLNIQESTSVAVEQMDYIWRFGPEPMVINSTPQNDRAYLNLIDKPKH